MNKTPAGLPIVSEQIGLEYVAKMFDLGEKINSRTDRTAVTATIESLSRLVDASNPMVLKSMMDYAEMIPDPSTPLHIYASHGFMYDMLQKQGELPVVTEERIQSQWRDITQFVLSGIREGGDSPESIVLQTQQIRDENPGVGIYIGIVSKLSNALPDDQYFAQFSMNNLYNLLKGQAEANKMNEEIEIK